MIHFLIDNIKIDISKVSQRDKKDYLIMKDPDFTDSLVSNEERKRYADDENSKNIGIILSKFCLIVLFLLYLCHKKSY